MTSGLVLDAAWILVAVLCVGVVGAAGLAGRRVLIEHGGGTVECGLRRVGEDGWHLGLAAYQPDELFWYPAFGVGLRPAESYPRRKLRVSSRRPADPAEAVALGAGTVVVECRAGDAAPEVELAMSEDALTGFLAWLESAAPGPLTGPIGPVADR